MENQLFYHPTSREFRARGAVPQSLDSNAPLADGSRHRQVQMEQKSTDAFLFAANLIHLELCQQAERLLTTFPSSIVHQCYCDHQAILETVRHGQYTSQMAIADLAHVPHPTPALVSTQLAITHDIEHSSSTVDKNSEIMRHMWRKFRAAEWIGKAHMPSPSTSQSSIKIPMFHRSRPTVPHATIHSAGRFCHICGDLLYHRRPRNKPQGACIPCFEPFFRSNECPVCPTP
ncbi:hypothetical protein B0H14DRAFT_2852879 [Mycena olivaceomarginata]|nr:hypothetical protein B0H14DRAFT_2852879 [Mycena olivaceomarginata]